MKTSFNDISLGGGSANAQERHVSEEVTIDGSFGEGGGQIIRNAVTLACILKRKIQVVNIRANRPNPGLAMQHLESILALLQLTGAKTSSLLRKGATHFCLDGTSCSISNVSNVSTIDLKTAASITLCIQLVLPYLLLQPTPRSLTIIGGTHVLKAPNTDYMHRVFTPIMNRIGYKFNIQLLRPGYFPRGGGRVILNIHPGNHSGHSFCLIQRGSFVKKSAILNLTPPLFENHKIELLNCMKSLSVEEVEIRRVSYASVEYFLEFEESALGFYRLVEGSMPKPTAAEVEEAIDTVEGEFKESLKSTACVDSFLQDQLIIYMTIAKLQDSASTSVYTTTAPLSDHTMSAIHVSELMTGLKFTIEMLDKYTARVSL